MRCLDLSVLYHFASTDDKSGSYLGFPKCTEYDEGKTFIELVWVHTVFEMRIENRGNLASNSKLKYIKERHGYLYK